MSAPSLSPDSVAAEIALHGISTSYGNGPVVSNVSLEIQQGEFLAIIGPSAGGKSTLLRCMNLLQPLTSGSVHFQGQLIADSEQQYVNVDEFRRNVGLVHQEWNLWPNKTVLGNLIEAPRHVLGMSRREAVELSDVWLRRCGISDINQRFPHELSGGQKQRVAIVRALIMNPSVVLMDEVTSALDVETTDRLLRLFESLKDGKRTFVFVSHHLNFVERATDRTVVLIDGKIAEVGDSRTVVREAQDPRTREFLSTVRAVR